MAFTLTLFRSKRPGGGRGAKPGLRDRMDAATWLADRGFGRPIQALEHSGAIDTAASNREETEALRTLTPADRAALRALLDKAGL